MKWFLVKLVFKIEQDANLPGAEFDEQYRLIEARNEEEAFVKSKIIGVKNEQTFENADGKVIHWQFIDTAFIRKIEPFTDGIELFSTTHSAEHARQYENFIHHQAEATYQRVTPQAITTD